MWISKGNLFLLGLALIFIGIYLGYLMLKEHPEELRDRD